MKTAYQHSPLGRRILAILSQHKWLLLFVLIAMGSGIGLTKLIKNRIQISYQSSRAYSEYLQSNFFKNEPLAQQIIAGTAINYSIDEFQLRSGKTTVDNPASTDVFAFRVYSALRMIGYTDSVYSSVGENPAKTLLYKFQRLNNLPQSPVISKSTLLLLDSELAKQEKKDYAEAPQFPLYPNFVTAPLNEPPKEHLVNLHNLGFKAVPPQFMVWSAWNLYWFFSNQLREQQKSQWSPEDSQICLTSYYIEYRDGCDFTGNVASTSPVSDFSLLTTGLHEYAHYLDHSIYSKSSDSLSAGVLDTTGFYNISYDTQQRKLSGGWKFYKLRRGTWGNQPASEFVSAYAIGWALTSDPGETYVTAYEDFAESFALYITGGKIFRELAAKNQYLQAKYDWLKVYVFGGQEFDTGDTSVLNTLKNQPLSGKFLVFNIIDYARANPDHKFTYELPIK